MACPTSHTRLSRAAAGRPVGFTVRGRVRSPRTAHALLTGITLIIASATGGRAIAATVAGEVPAAPPPQSAAIEGDPVIGKNLFVGTNRFENGGPPCMGCHGVAGLGAFGGGALGPDLTGSYEKFGQQGLASILANLPFPTMRPIFEGRALTPEEQAHLLAFLREADRAGGKRNPVGLAALAVIGAVLSLGLAHVIWRNRLRSVRRPLVEGG